MADTKITALTAISTNPVNPATFPIPMVDLLDTSMAASGTTKKVTVNQILGAGGTATLASATITGAATVGTTLGVTGASTLASATITGDLTVDTTTLVVNPSGYADRVGIGTATPGAALEVSGSATNVFIRSTDTNDSALRYYVNGTEVAVCRGKNGNSYAIETAGAESFRINSTGNIVLKGGTAAANGVGVTFPATQVDSSDANCLDDYEEGTWVPVIGGNSGTSGQTYGTPRLGRYTKIGRQVTCTFEVALTAVGTITGYPIINGLPFTPTSSSIDGGSVSIALAVNFNVTLTNVSGYIAGGSSFVWLTGNYAASTSPINNLAVSDITNTTKLVGVITYFA